MDNEQQQTPVAGTPIYQESQEKNAKWLWILIVLIIIAALAFAFFKKIGPFSRFGASEQTLESPSPFMFSSPSPSSEATSGAQLDRSQPKIRILNGSGKVGVASVVKDFLESRGYKVTAIGNAANYDFTNTFVRFKDSFRNFEGLITTDLASKYSVKTSSDPLESTDSADIEVIVGTK